MAARKVKPVDVSKLTPAQIDKMSPAALQAALKSVIRPGAEKMHQNHNSHSNVASKAGQFNKVLGAKQLGAKRVGAKRVGTKKQRG